VTGRRKDLHEWTATTKLDEEERTLPGDMFAPEAGGAEDMNSKLIFRSAQTLRNWYHYVMNESALAIQIGLNFAYQDNRGWQGYARTCDAAWQECEEAAQKPLRWSQVKARTWAAEDLHTGLVYHVEQLPL